MSCLGIQLFFLAVLASGCSTYQPSVRLESALAPQENPQAAGRSRITSLLESVRAPQESSIIGGSDRYQFVRFRHKPNTPEMEIRVLVHDVSQDKWKRITEVSLKNAKLGYSPRTVSVYWDFSKNYRGKKYAPVPLRTGSDGVSGYSIEPDKIEFDVSRSVYLLWFTTKNTPEDAGDPYSTRLEIRKKDLDDAFKR